MLKSLIPEMLAVQHVLNNSLKAPEKKTDNQLEYLEIPIFVVCTMDLRNTKPPRGLEHFLCQTLF